MLKPKRLAVFVLLLALLLASSVLAGPKKPQFGDPDIVEGIRTKGKVPRAQVYSASLEPLVVNIPYFGRIILVWQEQRGTPQKMAERLPAVSSDKHTRK